MIGTEPDIRSVAAKTSSGSPDAIALHELASSTDTFIRQSPPRAFATFEQWQTARLIDRPSRERRRDGASYRALEMGDDFRLEGVVGAEMLPSVS